MAYKSTGNPYQILDTYLNQTKAALWPKNYQSLSPSAIDGLLDKALSNLEPQHSANVRANYMLLVAHLVPTPFSSKLLEKGVVKKIFACFENALKNHEIDVIKFCPPAIMHTTMVLTNENELLEHGVISMLLRTLKAFKTHNERNANYYDPIFHLLINLLYDQGSVPKMETIRITKHMEILVDSILFVLDNGDELYHKNAIKVLRVLLSFFQRGEASTNRSEWVHETRLINGGVIPHIANLVLKGVIKGSDESYTASALSCLVTFSVAHSQAVHASGCYDYGFLMMRSPALSNDHRDEFIKLIGTGYIHGDDKIQQSMIQQEMPSFMMEYLLKATNTERVSIPLRALGTLWQRQPDIMKQQLKKYPNLVKFICEKWLASVKSGRKPMEGSDELSLQRHITLALVSLLKDSNAAKVAIQTGVLQSFMEGVANRYPLDERVRANILLDLAALFESCPSVAREAVSHRKDLGEQFLTTMKTMFLSNQNQPSYNIVSCLSNYLQVTGQTFQELTDFQKNYIVISQPIMKTQSKNPIPASHVSCANCGNPSAKKRCGRCKSVVYCDRNCQSTHWKDHKIECKSP